MYEITFNGNFWGDLPSWLAAIFTFFAAAFAWKIGKYANTIAAYETVRKPVEQILEDFEEAKRDFYSKPYYQDSNAEIYITYAAQKADLYGFVELKNFLEKIRDNLLRGHCSYALQKTQTDREDTQNIFAQYEELKILWADKQHFKKLLQIN